MEHWIPFLVLIPMAIVVVVMNSKLKDPSLEKLTPLPDETTLFDDDAIRWGAMPSYRRAAITSVAFMKGRVRVTSHRIIFCQNYAFSKRFCIRGIAYYKGGVPPGMGELMVDGYPSFTLDQASVETTRKGKQRLHLAAREKGIGQPEWVEIETERLGEYGKVLGVAL